MTTVFAAKKITHFVLFFFSYNKGDTPFKPVSFCGMTEIRATAGDWSFCLLKYLVPVDNSASNYATSLFYQTHL